MAKKITEVDLKLIDDIRSLTEIEIVYLKGWVAAKQDSQKTTNKEVS